jgi:outer membrane protein assembly factor BamB
MKRNVLLICIAYLFWCNTHITFAQTIHCDPLGDIDCSGAVNSLDLSNLLSKFDTTDPAANLDNEGKVNSLDLGILLANFGKIKPSNTPTPITPQPTSNTTPPPATPGDWPQDAKNAQRTGYTPEEPNEPWTYVWTWNGPDANGGTGNHAYNAPREARTITGGGKIYVPAGPKGLYALNLSNGAQLWNLAKTTNATPAYDQSTGSLITGSADGNIYKVNTTTGGITGTIAANAPINKAILIANRDAYAVSDKGTLYKINIDNWTKQWAYESNASIATLPSYSPSRNAIIFATDDLNVHAVGNTDGTQKWKVKPTPNTPGFPNEFEYAWPVIAEQHGIVFLRMRLKHEAMIAYPGGGKFANDFATIRSWLQANPTNKNLFALNLDNGTEKFIPAIGYGSTEDWDPGHSSVGGAYGSMGTQPVIKQIPGGPEVAYMLFRNGQSNPPDYRWDGHMGEMVLDNTTISGLSAGDSRFIKMARHHTYSDKTTGVGYVDIIDEQTPLTVAGDTIINAHWAASVSTKITDRSSGKGLTFQNPITTKDHPTIIRAQKSCSNQDKNTHWTTCGLTYVTDGGRFFNGPGWWVYWNVADPPGWNGQGTTAGTAYSAGILPRYTYVSNGYIIVEGNGGELFVLKHS